jgi:Transglycosylase SLT domain
VTATAVTAITGVVFAGALLLRANQPGAGAVIAVVLPNSHAMTVLEQQRQQMIVMDVAAHTTHLVSSPKVAAVPVAGSTGGAGGGAVSFPPPNPGTAQSTAYNMMSSFGFDPSTQFGCLDNIWSRESGWNYQAQNASGAYGIPQALPGSKMASAGSDWQTNPATQIRWGLGYIKSMYGTPCGAWAFWQNNGWY